MLLSGANTPHHSSRCRYVLAMHLQGLLDFSSCFLTRCLSAAAYFLPANFACSFTRDILLPHPSHGNPRFIFRYRFPRNISLGSVTFHFLARFMNISLQSSGLVMHEKLRPEGP